MKKNHVIIMFALVIFSVGLAIYLSSAILHKTNNQTSNQTSNKTDENVIENNIRMENAITNVITESTENLIENSITSNETSIIKNEVIDDVNGTTNYSSETSKQKAIDLVKKDWGKDDSVYFYLDEEMGNGKYVVSVRNKTTTSVVVWYNVDLKNNKVEIQ